MDHGLVQDRQISNAGQAWESLTLATMWRNTVRVRIKRDTYDKQSYAVVDAWTQVGWQELHRLLSPAVLKVGRHHADVPREAAVDEARLLEMAWQVLGGWNG
jgi:hypothetical protein